MITVFLDTNVILDYLENRDDNVRYLIEEMIRSPKVKIVTSVFNVIEVIDKEKDIVFIGKLLLKRYSFDEISKMRRNRTINNEDKNLIGDRINQFLGVINEESYTLDEKGFTKAMELIQEHDLQSQDALIVATFLTIEGSDYFLSNDSDLIKELNEYKICNSYNLHKEKDREYLEKIVFGDKTTGE